MGRRKELTADQVERRRQVIAEGDRRMAEYRRERHRKFVVDVAMEIDRLSKPDGRTVTLSRELFEVLADFSIEHASDWHSIVGLERLVAAVLTEEFRALLSAEMQRRVNVCFPERDDDCRS